MGREFGFVAGEYAALDQPSGDIVKLIELMSDGMCAVENLDGARDIVEVDRVHEIS